MTNWTAQLDTLIAPAVARSQVTDEVIIGRGVLSEAGALAARVTPLRKAVVMADSAGFAAAGQPVVEALSGAGFKVDMLVISDDPLPRASVEEARPFIAALAADPQLFPVSVGSGVMNDLVKYAAFETDRRYMTIATAASMDGYTSAGAPLAQGGFKVTIPTRAPVAMLADLEVIAAAPAEMNAWGYGDLAGKVPAGGDWLVADALGAEPRDDVAWPLVQDNLRGWLAGPEGIVTGDTDTLARLFVGLTAVGFAMEVHGSSRPASGADHQIAHMWEMEKLAHNGRKVSHGAAVSVACVATLALYDWLLRQDLHLLDIAAIVDAAPDLAARKAGLSKVIANPRIADKARVELAAKHAEPQVHRARLDRLVQLWPDLRQTLTRHLYRRDDLADMLRLAGSPVLPGDIGVTPAHLLETLRAAAFIRRRYTIFDLLHETGLSEQAFADIIPVLSPAVHESLP